MTLDIWQVRLVTASLCEGWMICLRFNSLLKIVKALLPLWLTFSQEKRILRHSFRIHSQTMLHRYTIPLKSGCNSEAFSLPGPRNRDLGCDGLMDSSLWMFLVVQRERARLVSTAQVCCCSIGEGSRYSNSFQLSTVIFLPEEPDCPEVAAPCPERFSDPPGYNQEVSDLKRKKTSTRKSSITALQHSAPHKTFQALQKFSRWPLAVAFIAKICAGSVDWLQPS